MTQSEATGFLERNDEELRGIAYKAINGPSKNFIDKIHDEQDFYQEMWCHIMTMPLALRDNLIISEAARLAYMALAPQRTRGVEGSEAERPRIVEVPVDPDLIREKRIDRGHASWETWFELQSDVECILTEFEYEVFMLLIAKHPIQRKGHAMQKEFNGWRVNEIAEQLHVHRNTVLNTRNNIREKLMRYLAKDYDIIGYIVSRINEC